MSPVAPDAGGFVIMSQVRPQNDQGTRPKERHPHRAPTGMPKAVVTFLRGEPEVLGTTQIFTGILLISIFITTIIGHTHKIFTVHLLLYSGVLMWSGILFIISGSLLVAASAKPTAGKVTSSLVMNGFSCLAAATGIIITGFELNFVRRSSWKEFWRLYCAYKSDTQCLETFAPIPVYAGIISYIFMLFMLMFCITISTSVVAFRVICRTSFEEVDVVIYQEMSLKASDTTRDVPPDSTAALTSDSKTQT